MSVRLLNAKSSLIVLTIELRYTLSRCKANPLAQFCAPIFQSLRDECLEVQQQELLLQEQVTDAQAAVDIADEKLDDFSSRLSKTLLILVRDERDHPMYRHYFGKKSLSVFVKSKLAAQVVATKPWLDSLSTSKIKELEAMVPELTALLGAAKKALDQRSDAQAAVRAFRMIGARKQLFDKVNGARKEADGALTKLAIDTPGLPSDLSSKFFRSANAEVEQEDPTVESVGELIKDLTGQLEDAQALLKQLKADAEAEAKAAEEQAADEAALAALEDEEEALKKKKADLKKKLKKK